MLDLRNPFIMAPIKLGYSSGSGFVNDKHAHFYMERSQFLGAITLEPMYLDPALREIPTQIGIDNDDKVPMLKKLNDELHLSGAKVIAHLNHPGRMANPKIPGNYFLSSTDKRCENGGAIPQRMSGEDMDRVVQLFKDAAIRARRADFDIIELQMGHGYLLAQFISPAVNDRIDRYGGSLENRLRFPLEVLNGIEQVVDLPIIVRISGDEMIPGGIKIQEMIELARMLKDRGIKALHISAGTVCSTPPWFFQHMFVPKGKTWELARLIRDEIEISVIYVGRINSVADVDKLKKEYDAEYIALGRALVADPHFIPKYLLDIQGKIRPCLACSEGCLGGVKSGLGLHCVVNPSVGYEEPPVQRAPERKKYAVIGGGLAGMQAALTLKTRGHEVILYEKNRLGGQFNLAYLPPNKESLKEIVEYFENEIRDDAIPVIKQEADENELLSGGYDGVVIATGAVPEIPPIEGLKEYYWAEFLLDENLPENKKIVVIGGGLVGVEIASKLIEKDNYVIIVEMLGEIANGMEMIDKTLTMQNLKMKKVPMYTAYQVRKVDGNKVFLSGDKEIVLQGVDKIVVATGMRSFAPLYDQLKGKLPVFLIGDARKVGKAQDAIRDAYVTAKDL
ncbi:MAG: FAD-dependent oxidoreductase [Calditrichia bacterium]